MAALAKAQGQMEAASKDSSNPHFKSKYADLSSVWEACRMALSSNSLAISQVPMTSEGKYLLVTILGHSSGQWIRSEMELPLQKAGPHELGSWITYCRRYALASLVGIYPDEDEDGNIAQKATPKEEQKEVMPLISADQYCIAIDWVAEYPRFGDYILKKFKIDHLSKLKTNEFSFLETEYNKKKSEEKDAN